VGGGEEAGIRDLTVPGAAQAFNYEVIDGKGATANAIAGAARTLPMMAPRRMVLVRDISAVPGGELGKLVNYLDDPSETTVLLAVTAKVDKRIKFFARAKKLGFLHELIAPRNPTPWLRQEARARGINLSAAAASRMVDVIGADLSRLALSLDQLALYAGDRAIEVDHVDDLIAQTRERTVFELTDAIGLGDRPRALTALAALFDQRQSAIGVVMMLARHVRQLAMAHASIQQRQPKAELARSLGVPPFIVDKIVAQARRMSAASLDRALSRLAETDYALKGGRPLMKTLGRDLGERILLGQVLDELLRASHS
jgi:DNA polymerase III subunit delta